ncbi:hypothetical protein J2X16_002677 [Pelomonas aquatica]|uniref:Uncharacterized protein n=1 Tax=Pelomonas aquatica TaxID=431058 RepID=A0ABU1ZBH1_9BURK|nr:hypothetical protein [Pelomonas aquatica]
MAGENISAIEASVWNVERKLFVEGPLSGPLARSWRIRHPGRVDVSPRGWGYDP